MSLLHNRFHISRKVHRSSEKAENISSKSHRRRVRSFGRIRIRISDLWRSFRANSFSDLSNPLWTRIHRITDLSDLQTDHRINDLGEGSEINHCAQRFWPWITYVLHIWDPLPCVCLLLSEIHQKIDKVPVKYKYLNGLCKTLFRFYHKIVI